MNRPRIIHCIDSLSVGGTEILLKNTIEALPQFDHIVVYLRSNDELKKSFDNKINFVCLNYRGWASLPEAVFKLRKLIRQAKPLLVHSHLFYSTLVARLAVPRSIPLLITLHSIYSIDAFNRNRLSVWAERLTLKRRHILIAVSKFVLEDYLARIPHKGRSFVLYNFLPPAAFRRGSTVLSGDQLKCVAVGGLKDAKNYPYLLQLLEALKNEPVELDIYGEGGLRQELQETIDAKGLKVHLKGQSHSVPDLLPGYDLFLQASAHEGFGLSVIEAMARGVPVLISDIPVFHEITGDHAFFFPLDNPEAAAGQLRILIHDRNRMMKNIETGYEFVTATYNQERYVENLLKIYAEAGGPDTADLFSSIRDAVISR